MTSTTHDRPAPGGSECAGLLVDPNGPRQVDLPVALLPTLELQRAERALPYANEPSDSPADAGSQDAQPTVRGLVDLSDDRSPQRRFRLLQAWEGVVTEVQQDGIWADITDLTDRGHPTEIVEFSMDDIPQEDRTLLVPGGVFYWTIGYDTSPGGQVRLVSEIRLRRSPAWTVASVESVRSRARDLLRRLGGHVEDESPRQ